MWVCSLTLVFYIVCGRPHIQTPQSECPLCKKNIVNFKQHLRVSHRIGNVKERQLWQKLARGRVVLGGQTCPLCNKYYKCFEKHLYKYHEDVSSNKKAQIVKKMEWEVTMRALMELAASKPAIPMVTLVELQESAIEQNDDSPASTTPAHPPCLIPASTTPAPPPCPIPASTTPAPPPCPIPATLVTFPPATFSLSPTVTSPTATSSLSPSLPPATSTSPDLDISFSPFPDFSSTFSPASPTPLFSPCDFYMQRTPSPIMREEADLIEEL
nr:probable transport accessory protein MmpS3 [Misgurnus anguillicaudatus]